MSAAAAEELPPTLANIVEATELKWIFVGGKGGVGKTTTSCSLASSLSVARPSSQILLISTDPAHNLSDAFNQKFSKHASLVDGHANLWAMEIDPTLELDTNDVLLDANSTTLLSELVSAVPGIDEAMSFAELMKQVQQMKYDVIVFDTAPTGHTLRLLSFPSTLQKAFQKLQELREKFSGLFAQMSGMVGEDKERALLSKLESTRATIDHISAQFKNPEVTTFVCVCIPEFLSLFETERLVQELAKFEIDTHNIVVNQVLMPETGSTCRKCGARCRMQRKYLDQIISLYDDFHIVKLPLLDEEVRGPKAIQQFSQYLLHGVTQQTIDALAKQAASSSSSSSC